MKKKQAGRKKMYVESASFPFRKARCDKIRVIQIGLVRENVRNFYLTATLSMDGSTSNNNNDNTSLWQLLSVWTDLTRWRPSYPLRARNKNEKSPTGLANNKKSKLFLELLAALCFNLSMSLPERPPRVKSRSLLQILACESLRPYSTPF